MTAQGQSMEGRISNQVNGQLVDASMMGVVNGQKQLVGKTKNGYYKITLTASITALFIEAPNYRPLYFPIYFGGGTQGDYTVPITLIPVSKQNTVSPFEQSEQSQFLLEKQSQESENKAIRTFRVIDGFTAQSINAEICLFYTQTAQKKCFNVSEIKKADVTVDFLEKDIIAIEVRANGYQKYNGNLIIDNLDGQKRVFDIALNKIPTLLAIAVPKLTDGQRVVVSLENESIVNIKQVKNGQWFTNISPQKQYKISLIDKTGKTVFESKITTKEGLNLVTINQVEPIINEQAQQQEIIEPAKEVVLSPVSQRIIYFEQSDYLIKTSSLARLDTIVNWLKQNPTIRIRLAGHTDDVGDAKLNITLSEFRARVVRRYILEKGIAENRCSVIGYGGKWPAKPNDIEANKAINRRVEIGYILRQ
jgi:outer membrane protein OmpA-like peptidoglycan-associated protein